MMKASRMLVVAFALGGCLVPVRENRRAEGQVEGPVFTLSLPAVLPPLIVVRPGFSVVQDLDDEVFYADDYYWARRDAHWYHARDPHGAWARVEHGRVPPAFVQSPPGRYRHWRGEERGRN